MKRTFTLLPLTLLFIFVTFSSQAYAQGAAFSGTAFQSVTNAFGSNIVQTVPGALITVCSHSATPTTPCSSSLVTLYTDITLSTSTGTNVNGYTVTNPFNADKNGNFVFYAATNSVDVSVTGVGVVGYTYTLTGTGSSVPSLNNIIFVDGVAYPQTNVGIQNAINAAPSGGTVYLPAATYVLSATTNEQFKITKPIQFICAGWGANLQLASGVGTIPVMHIVPSGIMYGMLVRDCQFTTASGTPGSYGIQVDTSPNNPMRTYLFDHISVCGNVCNFGSGGIWFNNTSGEADGGIYQGAVRDSTVNGGIKYTNAGDQNVIDRTTIRDLPSALGGTVASMGVEANFKAGASSFTIHDSIISSRGCGLHIGAFAANASSIYMQLANNEIESPTDWAGPCANGSYIDFDGSSTAIINAPNVWSNALQEGAFNNAVNSIRFNWVVDANLAWNNFTRSTSASCSPSPGAGACVDFNITANSGVIHVRPNNFSGGDTLAHIVYNQASASTLQMEAFQQGATTSNLNLVERVGDQTVNYAGYGNTGLIFAGSGQNIFGDGVGANAMALSPAPNTSTIPSGVTTGFVAAVGTKPTVTGTGTCATSSTGVGGTWSGSIICTGSSGAATITFTFPVTATNFWACDAYDATTFTDPLVHGTHTNNSCTFSAAALVANDVIVLTHANPY